MTALAIGVLDFSVVSPGRTHRDALWETLELAEHVDRLGYDRYWVSEHHTADVAHAAPGVLVGVLAGITRHLRVGAAGVLLRYHAPYLVAAEFRLLSALYPGRIDLGLARGFVGADRAALLHDGRAERDTERDYAARLGEAVAMARSPTLASPQGAGSPELWVLGGRRAGQLAAASGAALCIDHFLAPVAVVPGLVEAYRRDFRPSAELARPRWRVAVAGLCAPTTELAQRLCAELVRPIVTPTLVGSPAACADGLRRLGEQYETHEFVFHDLGGDLASRKRAYELLAGELGLAPPPDDG
jgi:luciferase family oxidoreductase group 1